MRVPGAINIIWPTEVTSDVVREVFDYYVVGSGHEIRYIGYAIQGAATSDEVWIIKQLTHVTVATDDNRVADIQTLGPAAWDDRASLAWAT